MSKAKGGEFERTIAKALSLWFSEGKREDVFYRSHSSGARFTSRKKAGKDTALQAGDITCSDPIGEPLIKNWNIEVKTGYGRKKKKENEIEIIRWDVLDFIDSQQKEPVLQKMWTQCERDAKLTIREPVLIFRRNNRIPCIMFRNLYYNKLQDYFGFCSTSTINFNFSGFIESCVILSLSDFFEWIPNIQIALEPKIRLRKRND